MFLLILSTIFINTIFFHELLIDKKRKMEILKKGLGYALAAIGLIGIFLSTDNGKKLVPFLSGVDSKIILVVSGAIVVVGVILMVMFGKTHKQKHEEVPIYEGTGKKRRIVGYQRN